MQSRMTDELDETIIEEMLSAMDRAYAQPDEGTLVDIETDKGILRIQIYMLEEQDMLVPEGTVIQ
jgi:hypothetical protein